MLQREQIVGDSAVHFIFGFATEYITEDYRNNYGKYILCNTRAVFWLYSSRHNQICTVMLSSKLSVITVLNLIS